MDKIQFLVVAKDYFFYLINSTKYTIDDVNQANLEINKACREIESNVNILGINHFQYLDTYLNDIDDKIKVFENAKSDDFGSVNLKSRILTLIKLRNRIDGLKSKLILLNKSKNEQDNLEKKKLHSLSVSQIALLHYYQGKFGMQAITKQNAETIIKKYGFDSKNHLLNYVSKFKNEEQRTNFNRDNVKAARNHIDRFKKILPLLKESNIDAYNYACKEFKILEKRFKDHF